MVKTNKPKGGNIFLAGIIGAIAGAVGGLLLAPKSGKETRQDIANLANDIKSSIKYGAEDVKAKTKEVFGNASKAAVEKYGAIRESLINKVAEVKQAGSNIDKEKYEKIVDSVVSEFKDDLAKTKNGADKMAKQLKSDWEKIKKAIS